MDRTCRSPTGRLLTKTSSSTKLDPLKTMAVSKHAHSHANTAKQHAPGHALARQRHRQRHDGSVALHCGEETSNRYTKSTTRKTMSRVRSRSDNGKAAKARKKDGGDPPIAEGKRAPKTIVPLTCCDVQPSYSRGSAVSNNSMRVKAVAGREATELLRLGQVWRQFLLLLLLLLLLPCPCPSCFAPSRCSRSQRRRRGRRPCRQTRRTASRTSPTRVFPPPLRPPGWAYLVESRRVSHHRLLRRQGFLLM